MLWLLQFATHGWLGLDDRNQQREYVVRYIRACSGCCILCGPLPTGLVEGLGDEGVLLET